MGGQVLLRDRCLRCPALQSITGTAFAAAQARTRRANRPAQPHQVRVIQRPRPMPPCQPPPPDPEPARAMSHRVVRVQHDPVHAIIGAGQQVPVPLSEVIGHPPTVARLTSRHDISRTAPEGAILPGEVPGGA